MYFFLAELAVFAVELGAEVQLEVEGVLESGGYLWWTEVEEANGQGRKVGMANCQVVRPPAQVLPSVSNIINKLSLNAK